MINKKQIQDPISLPSIKGQMGDWYYYVTLLSFKEVAHRVRLPEEIDNYYKGKENLMLGDWIQRDLNPKRTKQIVHYLRTQPQRFFNSLILGIYEGNPSWQDISLANRSLVDPLTEEKIEYLSRTFGILNLDGSEDIFAIDGQHRAKGIREAVKKEPKLEDEEITVIFLGHKTTPEGKIRTRRLFSTLNKYAKPVNPSEIIALSEDNNCAIITRDLVDNFDLFSNKVLVIKNRSISPENSGHFTNILVLNDMVERILTNKLVIGQKVSGKEHLLFTTERASDKEIETSTKIIKEFFKEIIEEIPSLKKFFKTGFVNRKDKKCSLLFRPIGQNIFFDVLKLGIENSIKGEVLNYFKKENFNLANPIWEKVFWDPDTQNILPEKSRQKLATILILEHLGISIKKTKKDFEVQNSFGIDPKFL